MLFDQILNQKQKDLLPKLTILNSLSVYLAGGTALALQLGHRTSLDFDFDTANKFKPEKVASLLKIEPKKQSENTFNTEINGVKLSIFYYPYKLNEELVDFGHIKLASIPDIAAMKVAAVVQRAKQRDFFDLYYLIKKIGIKAVIEAAYAKYPWYQDNSLIIKQSLTFFEEADQDEEISKITVFDKKVTWDIVKNKISEAVKEI